MVEAQDTNQTPSQTNNTEPTESIESTEATESTLTLRKEVKRKLNIFWSQCDPERKLRSYSDLIDAMIDNLDPMVQTPTNIPQNS